MRVFLQARRMLLVAAAIVACGSTTVLAADNRKSSGPADSTRLHRSTRRADAVDLSQQQQSDRLHGDAIDFYTTALIYDAEGDIPNAIEYYLNALAIYPDSYVIRLSLGQAFFKIQRYADALDALVPAERKDAEGYALMADACRGLGFDDSASVFYLKVVELNPNNSLAFSNLAGYYRLAGNVDSTIWAYQNLSRLQSENYRILQEIAKLFAQTNRKDSAKAALMKSLDVQDDATNMLAYLGLAQLYIGENQLDSANAVLSKGLSKDPMNLMVLRELLNIAVRIDSLHEALGYAKSISRLTPLDYQAKRREAILYFGCDSLSQADSVLKYIIDHGNAQGQDYHYRGRIALVRNDLRKAGEHFEVVTKMADSLPQSWTDLAYVYRSLKEPDKEISTLLAGLSHMRDDSNSVRLLFALGVAYDQSGNSESAVQTFEELIAKHPRNDQALNYLGYLFADRGERLDYAQQLIERALEISPENAAYVDSYGWVKFRKGEFGDAVMHLKRAVALTEDPTIYDHLGDAYHAQGDSAEARRWWQKALDMTPDNATIRQKLSR